MGVPFSQAEFFQVFADYNRAVWPAQLALAVLAILVVALAFRSQGWAHRTIGTILGLLWIWMGVAYHWIHFTQINGAAWLFGGLSLAQGVVFLYLAFRSQPLDFRPEWDAFGLVGGAFIGYALVVYPMLGAALGHTYPVQPTFGLPCPTTIFTLGVLLWARPRIQPAILAIPVFWSLVGANAAFLFGVREDLALPVAGILGGVLVLLKNRRSTRASAGQ